MPLDEIQNAIEQSKIFREQGRYYFSLRSNLTYINVLACAAFMSFFAYPLVGSAKDFSPITIFENLFWLYVGGCVVYIVFAAWATAICNLLSNSFFGCMLISIEAEKKFGVDYSRHAQREWAATFEFTTEASQDRALKPFGGNVWNLLNGFLALYGMYIFAIVIVIHSPHTLFMDIIYLIDSVAVFMTLFLLLFISMQRRFLVWATWLTAIALLYAPMAFRVPEISRLYASRWPLYTAYAIAVIFAASISLFVKVSSAQRDDRK